MPHTNRQIPISLQLWDKDTSKHVRATVRLPSGAIVGGAPVTLTHVSQGYYQNSSVIFPLTADFVTVFYEVFDDLAHTVPSLEHSEAFDVFENLMIEGGGTVYGSLDDLVAVIDEVEVPLVAVVENAQVGGGF